MDTNELLEPFTRMLEAVVTPAAIREIESGGATERMWQEILDSGFLDALVSEDCGGAGLSLADTGPLIAAVGRQAVPLPVAETMVARSLLAEAGVTAPDGPIVLVSSLAHPVPCASVASHALVDAGNRLIFAQIATLAPIRTGVKFALSARLSPPAEGATLLRPGNGLRPLAAAIRAAQIAGAAARLTELTTAYANERVQFGKPIGKQQALQQMLAVMAEDMIACRIAAQMGLSKGMAVPTTLAAAAKATTSRAVRGLTASAHAVHGAIGISEECDLQLIVRRLHEWRLADGSEGYWAAVLGQARLSSRDPTVDWVRAELAA